MQLSQLQTAVAEKEKASHGYDSALEKADKALSDTRSSLDLLPSDQSSSAAIAAQVAQLKVICVQVFQANVGRRVTRHFLNGHFRVRFLIDCSDKVADVDIRFRVILTI